LFWHSSFSEFLNGFFCTFDGWIVEISTLTSSCNEKEKKLKLISCFWSRQLLEGGRRSNGFYIGSDGRLESVKGA
jgi:hypothetical protein